MSGIYIHTPFCASKCSYCDFYSLVPSSNIMDIYTDKLAELISSGPNINGVDSVYFGGGTPTLLGEKNLDKILQSVIKRYNITNCEVTLEANPNSVTEDLLKSLYISGFNRISFGVQSLNNEELSLLGRTHSDREVYNAINYGKSAGFNNISADIILGLPDQKEETVKTTVAKISDLGLQHISAYILKIEPNTPFAKQYTANDVDEDLQADIYLNTCSALSDYGFRQYEISNFAKKGYESKHNLKYWQLKDYLGIGPSAHSFVNGKRFYIKPDLKSFLAATNIKDLFIDDGIGGTFEEYVMLGLRLSEGLNIQNLAMLFPRETQQLLQRSEPLIKKNIVNFSYNRLFLDKNSFLISNSIINALL